MPPPPRLLALLPLALVSAADLATWSASAPSSGKGIQLTKQSTPWRPAMAAGKAAAELLPTNDYFKRASFTFELAPPAPAGAWLTVGYIDRGYGILSLGAGQPIPQRDMRGIAILNTGNLRHAAFRLPANASTKLTITGARYLHSLTLSGAEPPAEPIPDVKPAFTLKRPMDLVITAGADAPTLDGLPESLAYLRNHLPLMKALGFNGIESYVKWNFVERSPGVFDWSFYDAVIAEISRHGMKWFPLLIVGSAYALPDWFHESGDNVPFVCLEHNIAIEIPSIFAGTQDRYVRRFLQEFGKHYDGGPTLLGVRLGPSGNYGEAQYPATGAWGYKGRPLHTHIGYWAGDPKANENFRAWLARRYPTIGELNNAWRTNYPAFDAVKTFLPVTTTSERMRLDFSTWYLDAMTAWCEQWAVWAKEAMPRTSIYQSSGGWGAVEIGTDYAAHAKSMGRLGGGIRMTNENDSYLNNFGNTRLAAAAARFYGAKWGSEPAGFSSARGVAARIYNALVNDAEHLFFYDGNLTANDQAIDTWLRHAPLLDRRARPRSAIALFFNDTANKLRDDTLRYLRASAYLQRVHAFRAAADFDIVSEQMIADGALDRYQALVMVWGNKTTKPVLDRIDAWVQQGGTVFYPDRELSREGLFQTIEGDDSAYRAWRDGKTGQGRALLYDQQTEPFTAYVEFVRRALPRVAALPPAVRAAVRMRKPEDTFGTILEDGTLALLNYGDKPAAVTLADGRAFTLAPYNIRLISPAKAVPHAH